MKTNKKAYRISTVLAIVLMALSLVSSCSSGSRPATKDSTPISDEEFLSELERIYDETVEKLQSLHMYGQPLPEDTEEWQEFIAEQESRDWRIVYEEKRDYYHNIYAIYSDMLDRLGSLNPSEDCMEEYKTLCSGMEALWQVAYYEFANYDLCLQEGIKESQWSRNKDNPHYETYQNLVAAGDDSKQFADEMMESAEWEEMLKMFDFIDWIRLLHTS